MEKRKNSAGDMIIYAEDYYVHVIDGRDAINYRHAEAINKDIINEPYLFEALASAYRKNATVVDFTDVPSVDILV